jgi:hypothetical protein
MQNVDVEAPPRGTPNSNLEADRRLPLTPCSPLDSFSNGVSVERLLKHLAAGGSNQVFMIEVGSDHFDLALDSTTDEIRKNLQEWEQKGHLDQVAAWLLLKGMDRRRAMEVLSSCNTAAME